MSSNYYGSIAGEIADTGPACPVCRDTGWVVSADPTDGTPYESACPEPVHNLDTGDVRDPKGDEAAHA